MPNPVLAKRLKMARCGADLSREELADAISSRLGHRISGELLRRIEVGDRDIEFGMILAISEVTGEPVSWLTDGALSIPGYLTLADAELLTLPFGLEDSGVILNSPLGEALAHAS